MATAQEIIQGIHTLLTAQDAAIKSLTERVKDLEANAKKGATTGPKK